MGVQASIDIAYEAEPTGAEFHACDDFVRGLMGPIGSGKSVTCIQEMFRINLEQWLGPDGKRRTRWAVIRNTYPELKTTTIKSFQDWFGPIARFKFDSPIYALVEFDDYVMEFYFLAMDKEKDIKKLLSLELTGIFINEAKEVPKSVLDMGTGRVGRYPAKKDGGPRRSCVIMDTNPPDNDSWWYKVFEEEKPAGYTLFKQPSALLKVVTNNETVYLPNPAAENVKHQPLGFTYWTRQVPGKREEWINGFILGQYGSSHDGRPCFTSYNDRVHCSEEPLIVYNGLTLLIGVDFGRTPAAILGQLSPSGQLRVIDEVVVDATGEGMGMRKFSKGVLKPYLAEFYPKMENIMIWGDPSGVTLNDSDESTFDIMAQVGVVAEPAGSNLLTFRHGNVEYFLESMSDGEPGFLLDAKCKIVRKGFLGGYQYERLQLAGEARFKEQPMKNSYSHPHDGLQYLADLARHGTVKVMSKQRARKIHTGKSASGWA